MGMLGRMAAIGRGSIDRVLSAAETSVGLRAAAAIEPSGGVQLGGPQVPQAPFFPENMDWTQYGQDLVKGAAIPIGTEPLDDLSGGGPARKPTALANDPFQMIELLGYKDRPQGLAFIILDQMVRRTPMVRAVIMTRAVQVARHCRVQEDSHSIGFRVRHNDKKKNLSKVGRAMAEKIERALLLTTTGDPGFGRLNFAQMSYAYMLDSLTFDQACLEIIPSRRGTPYSWQAVDAKTIRLADTSERFLDADSDRKIRTLQILDGQPIHQWPASELSFWVRNPSTSIQSQGYGTGELEMLIHVVTSILWAYQYNSRFFSQGSTQKGVLNFKGQVPGRQLAAFRRFFYQMISGVENAWKTPILNAEQGVEWVSMHSNNKDMEYSMWMDFLIKLLCAMYMMDPSEVNMNYANDSARPMFEQAPEAKVVASKDKGLKPILAGYQDELNKCIVTRIDPDFHMEFLGLESLSPKEQAELDEIRSRTYVTIDEIREEEGKGPMADGNGKLLNSGPWLQYVQAKETAAMMAAMPQDPKPALSTLGPKKPAVKKPGVSKTLIKASFEI